MVFDLYQTTTNAAGLGMYKLGYSARGQLVCDPSALYDLNNCASLREHFPCAACTDSVGDDQPAFVAADAPEENQPGACLVNGGEVGCEGAHHLTTRLCACA